MLNALFILIVFLLQLNKDQIHVTWPLGVKENVTIVKDTDQVKSPQNNLSHHQHTYIKSILSTTNQN